MTMRSWIRKLFTRPVRTIRKKPRWVRLAVEELEPRLAPATFTVIDNTDVATDGTYNAGTATGSGSLRYCINEANTLGGNNTINFGSFFNTAQTITLGGSQLELSDTTGTTTITGPAVGVTISGNNASRVFQVDGSVTASISGLTITGGYYTATSVGGGGVYNAGTLTMTNSTISGNSDPKGGGGVYNAGTLTMTNSTISGNSTIGEITNTTSRGGGLYNFGTAMLTGCVISGNTAELDGGGIFNGKYQELLGNIKLTLNDCTISSNQSLNGNGGGLVNVTGVAGSGYIPPTAILNNCTISGNSAEGDGGGLYTYVPPFTRAYVLHTNEAGYGFGDAHIQTTLTNCTVSGNSAGAEGGAEGGGISDWLASLNLINCTVSGNTGQFGDPSDLDSSGKSYTGSFFSGETVLINTIVTSPITSTEASFDTPKGNRTIGDNVYLINSLVGFNSVALAPLGDYGGPTQTMPLLPTDTNAIDAGIAAWTPADAPQDYHGDTPVIPTTDQRGLPRAGATDIGAYEYQHPLVPQTFVVNTNSASIDPGPGLLSLPEAILLANSDLVSNTITFNTTDLGIAGSTNFSTPQTITETTSAATLTTVSSGGSLSDNTTYFYRISAVTLNGETGASPEASIKTGAGGGSNEVTVTWASVPGALYYNVYRGTSSGSEQFLVSVTAPTLTFTDQGTKPITAGVFAPSWLTLADTLGTETIIGPAAGVTISGGSSPGSNGVFQILANVTASFSGLTITGGTLGVQILHGAALTMTNCTVENNSGIGVYAADFNQSFTGGTATLSNCTVSGNTGTGVAEVAGYLTMTNCTISDNTGQVGGILLNGKNTTLTDCTISGNTGTGTGTTFPTTYGVGGIQTISGTATLINCTVSGNTGTGTGTGPGTGGIGGIQRLGTGTGTATLINCTVSGNTGNGTNGTTGIGGILVHGGATLKTINTIVAENTGSTDPDVFRTFNSLGNNLIGNTSGSTGFTGPGDQVGPNTSFTGNITSGNLTTIQSVSSLTGIAVGQLIADTAGDIPLGTTVTNVVGNTITLSQAATGTKTGDTFFNSLNPLLAPLANNGGPTQTMALQSGSPAIDKATAAVLTTLTTAIPDTTSTSITVASTAGLGAGLYIQIDSEIMQIIGVTNGTTLTVARGQLGTTAAAHLTTGVNVTLAADQRGAAYVNAPDIGAFEYGGVIPQSPNVTVNSVAITYGTALANSQLSGTATDPANGDSVDGTFTFTTAAGTVLDASTYTENVTFTPTDTTDYSTASTTVSVTVGQTTAIISITGVSTTYDGNGHAATGTATGVDSANLNSLLALAYSTDHGNTFTTSAPVNAGTYEVYYEFNPNSTNGNYNAVSTETDTGKQVVIGQATLTVTGITANNKPYDGTPTATLNTASAALQGLASGDTGVTFDASAATGTFASPDVATGITVQVAGITLGGTTQDGTAASVDYTLTQPTTTADISQATLTVTGITANNKPYDGTPTATLNTASAALQGLASGDTGVTFDASAATGTFASPDVATGITVQVAGITLGGTTQDGTAASVDYTLTQPTTTADISQATLTVTGITANNKPYDGTPTATLNTASAALQGLANGDTGVTFDASAATGLFASPDVATGITVQVAGITLGGTTQDGTAVGVDYTLTQPTTTADIIKANLTVTGITANNKPYDGTPTATLNTASAALQGLASGDTGVTFDASAATGTFASPDVATGITVQVAGITLGGTTQDGTAASVDYTLTQPTTTADISQVGSTVTVTWTDGTNTTYDGNQHSATASWASTGTDGGGGVLTVTYVGINGTTYAASTTAPTDAGDYQASASFMGDTDHTSSSNSATFTIGKADAHISVVGFSGNYDGTAHGVISQSAAGVESTPADLSSLLTVAATTYTDAPGGLVHWTFAGNTDYQAASGDATVTINKANAVIVVTPYTSAGTTYDGNAHTATVTSITGVNGDTGAAVGSVTLNTTHTNAGSYASDSWSFTGAGNYNDISSTTIIDSIAQAIATIKVTPYNVPYDGNAHTATGTATGIGGVNLGSDLTLGGTTHTNVGTYNGDPWSFHDAAGNYKDAAGTVNDQIVSQSSAFIQAVYHQLLGRPADAGGLANWVAVLNQLGNTVAGRAQIVADFETSAEYRFDEVDFLYFQYLHRSAVGDPGAQGWVNLLGAGWTVEQVAAQIAGSPEFIRTQTNGSIGSWLNSFYIDALHRSVDPSGLAGWSAAFAAGASRAQIAEDIFTGAAPPGAPANEYRMDLVDTFYIQFLGRSAQGDPGSLGWMAALQRGATDQSVIAGIMSGVEFYDKSV